MIELQLYDMDGHTWWLATSPGQALDSYSEYYRDEVDISQLHPTEVRDADLDRSETESPVAAEVLRKRSFRAQLAIELADDPTTPRMFATSEV